MSTFATDDLAKSRGFATNILYIKSYSEGSDALFIDQRNSPVQTCTAQTGLVIPASVENWLANDMN